MNMTITLTKTKTMTMMTMTTTIKLTRRGRQQYNDLQAIGRKREVVKRVKNQLLA